MKVDLTTMNMDSSKRTDSLHISQSSTAVSSSSLGKKKVSEDIVVGLDRDIELIRDKLVQDQKHLDVVSIVGMGGIGKTTLAIKLFNDPFVVYHFHVRAWVTVSQTYEKRGFLINVLASIGVEQDLENATDSRLREMLHKRLMGVRYLIVIDDIWSNEVWDNVKLFFPDDKNRSRILLTTRLTEVAGGFIHPLHYLTEEESWELLCEKVFHGNECPEWLVIPGMQIASQCKGLPLALVVIAGVLAKVEASTYCWNLIACDVRSNIVSDKNGCLNTLALSYHHLPSHLRKCFLYLGGFPGGFRVRSLIWLWVAEGFIQEDGKQGLEEIAEDYLMDLVNRNLLIVDKRKFNGVVKACKLHDLVMQLCLEKAKQERFFLKIHGSAHYEVIVPHNQRRIFTDTRFHILSSYIPGIRSLFSFNERVHVIYNARDYLHRFALLRVLNLRNSAMPCFPSVIALLVHLRYLAIQYSSGLLASISSQQQLQTLIVETDNNRLVNLRHLWSSGDLYFPSTEKPMNLQTIKNVVLVDGGKSMGKCFPLLKKLTCTLNIADANEFESLAYLEKLKLTHSGTIRKSVEQETLKGEPHYRKSCISFPATLKKLTLVKCCLPWRDMSIIQSLPKLEVLKLGKNAFKGTRWNTCGQQFRKLKLLTFGRLDIKHWEAYSTSFPCLKRLEVWKCPDLEEIPLEIGDIPTLEVIEIDFGRKPLLESLQRIQEAQHGVGNYDLVIRFDPFLEDKYSPEVYFNKRMGRWRKKVPGSWRDAD